MKMKLLGEMISNPTSDTITSATLVHVVAGSATDLILETDGAVIVGRIHIPANGSIDLVKDSTDTITCPTSFCTPVAYIS
jgi:hypothetical protein